MTFSISQSLRPVYHRMVRDRVLSERHFGQPTLYKRLLRIHLVSALMLSAPALLPCLWYVYAAAAAHYNYVAASGQAEPLSIELLQLHIHDRLVQDRRKVTLPSPSQESPLPTYGLVLSNDKLDRLGEVLPPREGLENYVSAHLTRGNQIYEVDVRYRGTKHWHWLGPQKSWKLRTKGGSVFDGVDTFNFLNTPDPMPFSEQMILDIARERGLLTPDYYPFRMLLNNAYLGVYFFETQPAAGLLRLSNRVPGSIFSGSGAPFDEATGISTLWKAAAHWKKVAAWRVELLDDFSELQALLQEVNASTPRAFAEFADRYLDTNKFAIFDALDVVFGNNQHDYHENHKLYFDPFRGRFEPIATDFRDVAHETELNRTENPLLLRLKQLPRYLSLRNRFVYELMAGPCSPQAMRSRTLHLLNMLEQDQESDPFWDAYELLPDMGDYYRHLPRPMNRQIQARAAEARLREHAERVRYLRGLLELDEVEAALVSAGPGATSGTQQGASEVAVDVMVDGHVGYRLTRVRPSWSADCRPEGWELYADGNLDDVFDAALDREIGHSDGPEAVVTDELELTPGLQFEAQTPHPHRGALRAVPEQRRYRLFIDASGCEPTSVRLGLVSLITARTLELETTSRDASETEISSHSSCWVAGSGVSAGKSSPHPWCIGERPRRTLLLGPGVVVIPETRVFGPEQTVVVAPGTTLQLGNDASLVFYGRVEAAGRADAPILVEPLDDHFGGIALQGPDTRGSRFSHVRVRAGTHPTYGLAQFPGTLSIHDTSDVELDDCTVSDAMGASDAIHVAYVQDFVLKHSQIRRASGDAIDVSVTQGSLDDVTVVAAAGDCIELLGSEVTVTGSRLTSCSGAAVSATAQSTAWLKDTLAARGGRGLSLMDGSTVSVSGVLLYDNAVGFHVERGADASGGKNQLQGTVLYAVRCGKLSSVSSRKLKNLERIAERLDPGDLLRLRSRVLGLGNWTELESALDRLTHSEAR